MLLSSLEKPITVLNLSEIDINISELQEKFRNAYALYGDDIYLLQQNKIDLIKSKLSSEQLSIIESHVWLQIYQGKINDKQIGELFPQLSKEFVQSLSLLKASRKRLISEFKLDWEGAWQINRIPSKAFEQSMGLTALTSIDYRLSPRQFKELPQELCDENLYKIIRHLAQSIRQERPNVRKMNVVIHHTVVYCIPNQTASNSPEGIHQDGMDYIMSALVVERKNIQGGRSIIYGSDKKTPLFAMELQAGQGIFQPDLGTELWHEVTPIKPRDAQELGYRSTIGVDIQITG